MKVVDRPVAYLSGLIMILKADVSMEPEVFLMINPAGLLKHRLFTNLVSKMII